MCRLRLSREARRTCTSSLLCSHRLPSEGACMSRRSRRPQEARGATASKRDSQSPLTRCIVCARAPALACCGTDTEGSTRGREGRGCRAVTGEAGARLIRCCRASAAGLGSAGRSAETGAREASCSLETGGHRAQEQAVAACSGVAVRRNRHDAPAAGPSSVWARLVSAHALFDFP